MNDGESHMAIRFEQVDLKTEKAVLQNVRRLFLFGKGIICQYK